MPWADSSPTIVARPAPKVRPDRTTPAMVRAAPFAATWAPRRGVTSVAGMMVRCRYSPPARILIIDDHEISRGAYRALLRTEGLDVVGDLGVDGRAVAAARALRPDEIGRAH